ncbi:hypothetical protein BaRGS_00028320 [Batillaria attramentaria]|uniref:Uncharacterized protein n=1 Tax=Batillaria attramentaria TaxID=370345 RepID=A0ABD0K071_9CAEN
MATNKHACVAMKAYSADDGEMKVSAGELEFVAIFSPARQLKLSSHTHGQTEFFSLYSSSESTVQSSEKFKVSPTVCPAKQDTFDCQSQQTTEILSQVSLIPCQREPITQ